MVVLSSFHQHFMDFSEPWVGTHTTGPGEATFVIKFDGEPRLLIEEWENAAQFSGVKTEEIRKGRIFEGVQGYLEGIFGDPSLTKFLGKT